MVADVTRIYRYQAHCQDCGWFSGQFLSEHAANIAAANHDDDWHSTPEVDA